MSTVTVLQFVDTYGRLIIKSPRTILPHEITVLGSPRENQDIRMSLAYSLFESCDEANILLYGATRSGRTTSLIAESINRNEKFLILEPTNEILWHTVQDAKSSADGDRTHTKIINIPSNKVGCIKIKQMIKKTPELKSLPIIPLPDQCTECKFYNICGYTEILRTADDDIDGISFTYDKGTALLAGNNSTNKEILNKIFSTVKNAVFDECHWLETEKTVSIPIPVDDNFSASIFKKYEKIMKSIATFNMLCKFMDIVDDELVRKAIREVYEQIQHKTVYEASLKRVLRRDNGTKFDRLAMCNAVYGEIVSLVESSQFIKT